jgi:hypothetical protein
MEALNIFCNVYLSVKADCVNTEAPQRRFSLCSRRSFEAPAYERNFTHLFIGYFPKTVPKGEETKWPYVLTYYWCFSFDDNYNFPPSSDFWLWNEWRDPKKNEIAVHQCARRPHLSSEHPIHLHLEHETLELFIDMIVNAEEKDIELYRKGMLSENDVGKENILCWDAELIFEMENFDLVCAENELIQKFETKKQIEAFIALQEGFKFLNTSHESCLPLEFLSPIENERPCILNQMQDQQWTLFTHGPILASNGKTMFPSPFQIFIPADLKTFGDICIQLDLGITHLCGKGNNFSFTLSAFQRTSLFQWLEIIKQLNDKDQLIIRDACTDWSCVMRNWWSFLGRMIWHSDNLSTSFLHCSDIMNESACDTTKLERYDFIFN